MAAPFGEPHHARVPTGTPRQCEWKRGERGPGEAIRLACVFRGMGKSIDPMNGRSSYERKRAELPPLFPHRPDEFPAGYSWAGLLASRARLRFTGQTHSATIRCRGPGQQPLSRLTNYGLLMEAIDPRPFNHSPGSFRTFALWEPLAGGQPEANYRIMFATISVYHGCQVSQW